MPSPTLNRHVAPRAGRCISAKRVLVVTALKDELHRECPAEGVEVIHSGVGKVNAAIATTAALLSARYTLVVNYGTCGRIAKDLRGLLEISQVVQRDMMAMPLAPRGITPLCKDDLPVLLSGHGSTVCGTGDSFVTADDPWLIEAGIDVVDMELFAIASACRRFGVAWRAFKFVTDDANDLAHEHWSTNVSRGEDLFWTLLNQQIIGSLEHPSPDEDSR